MSDLIPNNDEHLERIIEDEFEWSVRNNQTVRFHKIVADIKTALKGTDLPTDDSTPPQSHLEAHSSPQGSTPNSSKQTLKKQIKEIADKAFMEDRRVHAEDLMPLIESFATTLAEERVRQTLSRITVLGPTTVKYDERTIVLAQKDTLSLVMDSGFTIPEKESK